jgi:hypothetical protein
MRSKFAAVAAVVGAAAASFGLGHVTHSRPGQLTSMTYTGTTTDGSGVDAAPAGPSVGDQFFETGVLRQPGETHAGTYVLVTQLVAGDADHGQEQQSVTLHLADGDITALGSTPTEDRYTIAVVGGTGRYLGARGSLTGVATDDAETLTVTLEH